MKTNGQSQYQTYNPMKNLLLLFIFCLLFSIEIMAQVSPAYKDSVFTEYFRRTSGWTASDATISVPTNDGKVIWLFGDTHIDNYNAADTSVHCLFQVRNSMMVQDKQNPANFITILDNTETGINRTPIKVNDNNASYFWPGHGYAKGDTAIIFWQRYAGADYTHIGNFVSKIYTPNFTDASSIASLTALPLPVDVEYGNAVVVDSADNYIYLYGMKKDWIIFRPYLARSSMGQDITGSWEFFDGSGWTDDPNTAAQIFENTADYVSPSFSVFKLQGKYYMISQDIGFLSCGLGRDIYSWESNSPEGPFKNKKLLYTIEDKYKGEYWVTYNATAHPEFIENNELLISYNVNGFDNYEDTPCQNECQNAFTDRRNADGYRPKFIRVPLSFIDSTLSAEPPAISGLKVQYQVRLKNNKPRDNKIQANFKILNTGTEPVPYDEITLRYWYTKEGNAEEVFVCDYAALGTNKVSGNFVQLEQSFSGADHYLELRFNDAGLLLPGESSGEIRIHFSKVNGSRYNEVGDYSYDPYRRIYQEWDRVTLHRNGRLLYGVTPVSTDSLNMEDNPYPYSLEVFPNPANGNKAEVNLTLESSSFVLLSIHSLTGQVKLIKNMGFYEAGNVSNMIDLSTIPRGIYLIQARTKGKTYQTRLIRQ